MQKKHVVLFIILALIVFIIADAKFGIDYLDFTGGSSIVIEGVNINNFEDADYRYSREDEFSISLEKTNLDKLLMNNPLGSIKITAEDRKDVKVEYTITIFSNREIMEADSLLNRLRIDHEEDNKALKIMLLKPDNFSSNNPGLSGVKVDYQIWVPEYFKLNIDNRYGELNVSGAENDVNLSNAYGFLTCSDIIGKTNIKSSYGETEVRDIKGDLELSSSFGQAEVNNVTGKNSLDFSYGQLNFSELHGKVKLNSYFSDVVGEKLNSSFQGNINYGSLKLVDVKYETIIEGSSSAVFLELSPEFGNYKFDLKTRNGVITTNLPFEVEGEDTGFELKGQQGTGEELISVETKNANIEINH